MGCTSSCQLSKCLTYKHTSAQISSDHTVIQPWAVGFESNLGVETLNLPKDLIEEDMHPLSSRGKYLAGA